MTIPILVDWIVAFTFISGKIFGHPKYKDGDMIITSHIVGIDESQEGIVIVETHSGSRYRLGTSCQGDFQTKLAAIRSFPDVRENIVGTPTIPPH